METYGLFLLPEIVSPRPQPQMPQKQPQPTGSGENGGGGSWRRQGRQRRQEAAGRANGHTSPRREGRLPAARRRGGPRLYT